MQLGTVNFYDPKGQFIDHRLVEQQANQANISLRTGCFCNPGDGELAGARPPHAVEIAGREGAFLDPADQRRVALEAGGEGVARLQIELHSGSGLRERSARRRR